MKFKFIALLIIHNRYVIIKLKIIGDKMNIVNTPNLETERLILRKFTENDINALYLLLKDEEVMKFLPSFPLSSIQEAKKFYEKTYADAYKQKQSYKYAICLKTVNFPIGFIKTDIDDSYDFGYALRKEFWHQGIVREASKRLIEQLKSDGIPYITATHDINNPRSGNVMKAIGMHYKYSYRELWQPKNISVIFRMYQLNFDGNDDMVYKKYWDKYEDHFIETTL